jgi:hypothetical protein
MFLGAHIDVVSELADSSAWAQEQAAPFLGPPIKRGKDLERKETSGTAKLGAAPACETAQLEMSRTLEEREGHVLSFVSGLFHCYVMEHLPRQNGTSHGCALSPL